MTKVRKYPAMNERDKEVLRQVARDAGRWRKLMQILDHMSSRVLMDWDDVTATPHIAVGSKPNILHFDGGSFGEIIDSLPETE